MMVVGAVSSANKSPQATGGTIVTSGGYKYHTFTGSSSLSWVKGIGTLEYLCIAGGASGGKAEAGFGGTTLGASGQGGGGAGGVLNGSSS